MGARDDLSQTLRLLEGLLAKLPGPLRGEAAGQIAELRRLLLDQRPPRLALVGRRGAGKSSLVNALFGRAVAPVGHERATTGQARWEAYRGPRGALDILDTRGLQEGSAPVEPDPAPSAVASIVAALEHTPPDAILFLVKATEADAAIDGDLDALSRISSRLRPPPPVVAVLTQCDLVEPKNTRLHLPDDDGRDEKLDRVERIRLHLDDRLRARFPLVRTVPVSAYLSFRPDGALRADERWNLDALLSFLVDELPDEAQIEIARLSQVTALQRRLARRVVHTCATLAAIIGATPLPVADLAPLTALQVQMVMLVGYVAGRQLDARAVTEFLAGLGVHAAAGVGLRELARQLLKLAPGAGPAASAAIAAAGTKAIGEAAIAWFLPEVSG